jgi:hypothetical protein
VIQVAGFGDNEIFNVHNATGMMGPAKPPYAMTQLCNTWTIKVKDGVSYVQ